MDDEFNQKNINTTVNRRAIVIIVKKNRHEEREQKHEELTFLRKSEINQRGRCVNEVEGLYGPVWSVERRKIVVEQDCGTPAALSASSIYA
jgi:hypothetical protein